MGKCVFHILSTNAQLYGFTAVCPGILRQGRMVQGLTDGDTLIDKILHLVKPLQRHPGIS